MIDENCESARHRQLVEVCWPSVVLKLSEMERNGGVPRCTIDDVLQSRNRGAATAPPALGRASLKASLLGGVVVSVDGVDSCMNLTLWIADDTGASVACCLHRVVVEAHPQLAAIGTGVVLLDTTIFRAMAAPPCLVVCPANIASYFCVDALPSSSPSADDSVDKNAVVVAAAAASLDNNDQLGLLTADVADVIPLTSNSPDISYLSQAPVSSVQRRSETERRVPAGSTASLPPEKKQSTEMSGIAGLLRSRPKRSRVDAESTAFSGQSQAPQQQLSSRVDASVRNAPATPGVAAPAFTALQLLEDDGSSQDDHASFGF